MRCLGCNPFGLDMIPEVDLSEVPDDEDTLANDLSVQPDTGADGTARSGSVNHRSSPPSEA